MLTQIAEGVLVHRSAFVESNAVVVAGRDGVLLVDPGVHAAELDCLAADLAGAGLPVVAGFSTHPHWDHLLWDDALGTAPRLGTAQCAATVRERLAGGIDAARAGIPDDVPLGLLGAIEGLPEGAVEVPWDGPRTRVLEHRAHAPGHAALVVEERRVLIAGDLVSDVLVPLLDLQGGADPVGDYLAALELLEEVLEGVDVVVPGHGSVATADETRARAAADRAYVEALRDGREPDDPRIGGSARPGWEWVTDVHARQAAGLAQRGAVG